MAALPARAVRFVRPMTDPGIAVRGATIACTRRTVLRKAFLGPWHALVEDIWLYALADAQFHTGVSIHSGCLVINHEHLTVTGAEANVSEFLRRVHVDVSRALNALLCQERYDAPRELFDDRSTHQMRLLDAEAQASHIVYEHLNPVAAGLVTRVENMPITVLDHRSWRGGPRTVERPPIYYHWRRRPPTRALTVEPPPELYRAFGGDMDGLVHHMKKMCEHGRGCLLEARKGRAAMGAKAVQRIHPWSEPKTLRETGGQPIPRYKVGAKGIVAQQLERDAAADQRRFLADHREARLSRKAGDMDARFPYGTNAAVHIDGAPVEPEPYPDAVLTRPGSTLAEVRAELAQNRTDGDGRHTLVDNVRAAFTEEAADIVAHDDIELAPRGVNSVPSAPESGENGAADSDERAVEVRHRFDKTPKERSSAVRVVTLRDKRRGRRTKPPPGSDPPR